jgi:very-short-patch-repair endonuclease
MTQSHYLQLQKLKELTGKKFISEYQFHPKRRWRFDFANLETQTAIEIEGGAYTNGRHTRGAGFVKDMEKYNMAIEYGWAVLRYTPDQMNKTKTYEQIKIVLQSRLMLI